MKKALAMQAIAANRLWRRATGLGRRYVIAIYAVAAVVLGFAIEGLLIAPIVFSAHYFGFWPGMAVFTVAWLVIGLAVLSVTVRVWPEKAKVAAGEDLAKGPVRQRIARLAHHSKPLGAVAIAWFFGPTMSPPFFRALGYRDGGLLLWVVASAPIFCVFWYAFYGGGLHLLVSFF